MEASELCARRIIAQSLLTPRDDAPAHMLATQAQLYDSGVTALARRSTVDVASLIASQRVVRTWSQRGTHHFLAAADAQWMMRLCNPRVAAYQAKRRASLGLTEEMVTRAETAFREALDDGPLSRNAAYAVFRDVGIDPTANRGTHLLRAFGGSGAVVQGPRQGKTDTFMLVSKLPVQQHEWEGDAALAELARRYFISRGPAKIKDLAWWSGLTVRDAKKATQLASGIVERDGWWMGEYQYDISQDELDDALEIELSLPAFDEYLIGYQDRSYFLPAALVPTVGPTKNGMCYPFRVVRGMIVGRVE